MKKILIVLLVATLIFSLVGCKKEETKNIDEQLEEVLEETLEVVEKEAKQTGAQRVNEKERPDDGKSLQIYVDAYIDIGGELYEGEFSFAKMIGAIDGAIVYVDNYPVSLFEFATDNEVQDNIEEFNVVNGRFAASSLSEELLQVFESIE